VACDWVREVIWKRRLSGALGVVGTVLFFVASTPVFAQQTAPGIPNLPGGGRLIPMTPSIDRPIGDRGPTLPPVPTIPRDVPPVVTIPPTVTPIVTPTPTGTPVVTPTTSGGTPTTGPGTIPQTGPVTSPAGGSDSGRGGAGSGPVFTPPAATNSLGETRPLTATSVPAQGTTPRVNVSPYYTIEPRVPQRLNSGSGGGSVYSFGSNPNCSSYKSFEGFGGRPCSASVRRTTIAQSSKAGRGSSVTRGSAKGTAATRVAVASAVINELIIEVGGSVTEAQAFALAQRHRLTRIESQNFPLIGATLFRWRIPDNRSVETVRRQLLASGSILSVQRNFRFALQQTETAHDDPGQYAIEKLHLMQAHAVTKGDEVRIAVIDSGIDVAHPEFAGAIAVTYDALRSTEGPHTHGTGVAGAIVAKSRLLGSAPSARLIAIRAFGATATGAESTSFALLKSMNYAVEQDAKIINMSFAGPKDPLLERAIAAAAKRGVILVAAAGNAGPKSPPLYPAADRNVIAVSATDNADKLFGASNRGKHISLAAPGVDLLLPSPDEKYQVTSGTSFAAAYVSGIAALIVERNPGVTPDAVRRILEDTARDLGPRGKDDLFGAGLANAQAVVQGARPVTAGAGTRSVEVPKTPR